MSKLANDPTLSFEQKQKVKDSIIKEKIKSKIILADKKSVSGFKFIVPGEHQKQNLANRHQYRFGNYRFNSNLGRSDFWLDEWLVQSFI